ncbi:hypothetical protein [Paludifilum halophilum]|uniref:Uncharacterized protein n=1 Tax=Paludifilum halophilum TaxID=1642702 RepID=A0A235B9D3_9BACL|nr:hypothetical protein [Paludifilum halophilum]OYD08871.1 hypothetical protein CHM34_03550 [Paludifilum halophilum]
MEVFQDFFSELVGGFARLVTAGFIVWMIFIVFLFFRELFTPGDIRIRSYLYRVWKMFLFSFEITAYGGVIAAPFLMNRSEEYLRYGVVMGLALLASAVFLKIRIATGRFGFRKKQ